MERHDALIDARDLASALGFLTRVPVPVDGGWATARGAGSAWAYPIVGAFLGAFVALLASLLLILEVPPAIAAATALAASVFVTGALHEDGLADTVDGLWGGWTRERRLEIMKDSRIGTYGVLALVFAVLLRWLALAEMVEVISALWGIVAVFAASRAAMVPLMRLPNARGSGVSASVGAPSRGTTVLAVGFGALALVPMGLPGVFAGAAVVAVTLCMAALAQRKIGGQTGDILGATQQLSEIAGLVMLTAVL